MSYVCSKTKTDSHVCSDTFLGGVREGPLSGGIIIIFIIFIIIIIIVIIIVIVGKALFCSIQVLIETIQTARFVYLYFSLPQSELLLSDTFTKTHIYLTILVKLHLSSLLMQLLNATSTSRSNSNLNTRDQLNVPIVSYSYAYGDAQHWLIGVK